MDLPDFNDLNNFNRVLMAVSSLSVKNRSCNRKSLLGLCRSIAYGGRPIQVTKTLGICSIANLITIKRGRVKLTDSGKRFLELNPCNNYEVTETQKEFVANELIFNGIWQSQARDLFLTFEPNYNDITYELSMIDSTVPLRFNAMIHLLIYLKVLLRSNGILSVSLSFLQKVRDIRATKSRLSQDQLEQALRQESRLSDQAEDAVVEFERKRLINLDSIAEAERVKRISQLDVSAGYDVLSFSGKKKKFEHDRFIEVKSSSNSELHFYWSEGQYKVAQEKGDMYWIYFVGAFHQNQHENICPIMIQDPANRLSKIPQIEIGTAKYVVSQVDELPLDQFNQENVQGFLL